MPPTPGPWKAVVDIAEHPQWFRVDAADGSVCVPCYGREPRGIDEANAHLIAAAPDLLVALKGFLDQPETSDAYDAAMQAAEVAIAKAEGR